MIHRKTRPISDRQSLIDALIGQRICQFVTALPSLGMLGTVSRDAELRKFFTVVSPCHSLDGAGLQGNWQGTAQGWEKQSEMKGETRAGSGIPGPAIRPHPGSAGSGEMGMADFCTPRHQLGVVEEQ